MIDPVREGEMIAQQAHYQRDKLIEDFRAANIAHCALLLSTNPDEEQIARGEEYGRQGDALRAALALSVEGPEGRLTGHAKPERRMPLLHLLHRRTQPA